ncbi:MAG: HD domain-containing phosphohydrolase [Acidobacteriota bacterium]
MRIDAPLYAAAETATLRRALAGHSRKAARYALLLAQVLGIGEENVLQDLFLGALLHDIGKVVVPGEILAKAGPLTPGEREIIREHPGVGWRLIREFRPLKAASEIVLCHHERFDGGGYPAGLAGDRIPLGARIFSLADTLDAITSDRPYRRGRPFETAMQEIGRAAGSQFDPAIVGVFLSVPSAAWRRSGLGQTGALRLPRVN